MAALTGAAVGAGVGGLTGALVGMGIPEFEAKRYEGKVKGGNVLISVHTENAAERARAKMLFEHAGAHDIAQTGEAKGDYGSDARRLQIAIRHTNGQSWSSETRQTLPSRVSARERSPERRASRSTPFGAQVCRFAG